MAKTTLDHIKNGLSQQKGFSDVQELLQQWSRDGKYDWIDIFYSEVASEYAKANLTKLAMKSQEMMYERKPEVPNEGLQLRTFQVGIGVYAQEEVIKKAIEKTGNELEIISTEQAEQRGITIHSLPQEEVIAITDPYNKLNFPMINDDFRSGKQLRRERRKQERKIKK